MRGFAVLVLLMTVMVAVLAKPVLAQRAMSDSNKQAIRDAVIRDPANLVEVCNVLVFRKFGTPGPRYGGTYMEMDRELHAREHSSCIANKAQGFYGPGETPNLRWRPVVPAAVREAKAVPEARPAPDRPAPEVKLANTRPRSDPAPAQDRPSQRPLSAATAAIVNDANRLAELCNQLVFRKYGQAAPLRGPRWLEMEAEHHARAQNSCIMSKGRNY